MGFGIGIASAVSTTLQANYSGKATKIGIGGGIGIASAVSTTLQANY